MKQHISDSNVGPREQKIQNQAPIQRKKIQVLNAYEVQHLNILAIILFSTFKFFVEIMHWFKDESRLSLVSIDRQTTHNIFFPTKYRKPHLQST